LIIDRKHTGWGVFVVVATAVAGYLYRVHPQPDAPHSSFGSTPLGLVYGIVAGLIFVFAALLGARRQRKTWRIGSAQAWLRAHIWLSVLTIPLVLFHADFSLGSPMTTWLMTLYAAVMISGFYGLALQQWLPRLMKQRVTMETIYEQIPVVLAQLHESAKKLRETLVGLVAAVPAASTTTDPSSEAFAKFLDDHVLPYLAARRGEKLPLGRQQFSDDAFGLLKVRVAPEFHKQIELTRRWCDERRQLDLQTKLHHWLHWWVLVHAPLSFALLAYTAWHVLIAIRYY
jgi:hypothetical protein